MTPSARAIPGDQPERDRIRSSLKESLIVEASAGTGKTTELVNRIVLSERALSRGYFNAEFIRELMARHERGSWDYSSEIFRLLMLELWHREYFDAPAR